jgi:protoporphyrinogen/coproporphyrinogen III oxidase
MRGKRVAVIGGGLAGLSAAARLQRGGGRVVVFEALDRLGGRAVTIEVDGHRVDAAAQLFGTMYERFASLLRRLGMADSMVAVPGRDALWRDGRAHEVVYGSVASMIASGGLPFRTKMRLGSTYVPFLTRHARSLRVAAPELAADAGLDRESIAEWGAREIDDAFVASLAYPQLAAYYGSEPAETSAGFYHILARYGMDVSLFAVTGGVGRVSDRLGEVITAGEGEVRLGLPVHSIRPAGGRVVVSAGGGEETFDGAICAAPGSLALDLLRDAAPLEDWLRGVRYRPAVTLALLLDRPVGVRYFGLSFPAGEASRVAAIAVQENKSGAVVPAGKGLLLAFATPPAAEELLELEPRDVLQHMLPEIVRAFPGVDRQVERARVFRWPVGSPTFYPGYLTRLGTFRRSDLEPPTIALAGDYLYGPSVEGAVTSGEVAADRLTRRLAD